MELKKLSSCCRRLRMSLISELKLIILLFVTGVHLMPVDFKAQNDAKLQEKEPAHPACFYKIVGSQGSIYSPHISWQNVTCEWRIDVTKGYTAVLEFEYLRLPVGQERMCEVYVEVTHGTQVPFKKRICPADKVDRLYTNSQVAIVRYHSGMSSEDNSDTQFGFKINYSAEAITTAKPQLTSNYPLIILLLSMATMCVIAICLFCTRCLCLYKRGPQHIPSDEPNVPTRQQLQETFEIRRSALQAERKKMSFSIFQSQGSSFSSDLNRWASNSHLPTAGSYTVPKTERTRNASIMTTPRSVFPELRRKWSEDSVKRMDHLRTKLVARFSSASSNNTASDISVFFPASERRSTYSQLSCEEDREPAEAKEDLQPPGNRESRTASSSSKRIPSIVIEFVK